MVLSNDAPVGHAMRLIGERDVETYTQGLAGRLRVARASRSPSEIARALDVSADKYLQWESGTESFPLCLIAPFCEITGFSPSWMVTGVPDGEWTTGTETQTMARRASASLDPLAIYQKLADIAEQLPARLDDLSYEDWSQIPNADLEALVLALEYAASAERCLAKLVE